MLVHFEKNEKLIPQKQKETNLKCKCPLSRSREKNKEIALVRLRDAVDLHLNGEDSVASQIRRIEQERHRRKKVRHTNRERGG